MTLLYHSKVSTNKKKQEKNNAMRGMGWGIKSLKVPHYAKFSPSKLIYAYGLRVNSSKYEKRSTFILPHLETNVLSKYGGR